MAALLSGALLSLATPALASPALATDTTSTVPVAAGPGAVGPDLSSANRIGQVSGMPDWSRAGYLGGQPLPGDGDMNGSSSCNITPDQLTSKYGVVASDGVDDTTGLQKAIEDIKANCSPTANFHKLSLITLPAGRIDVSRQMYVDASFLTIRGQGSGEGGTKFVFRPDANTRYDTLVNGRWSQDAMVYGAAPDEGNGGWVWPGRGMFRVQTRTVATRYQDEWSAAPANRKDLFEGSINQHWVSGLKLSSPAADPGFSARQGQSVVHLDPKANMSKVTVGGYVWVGAANSRKFYEQQGIGSDQEAHEEPLMMRQQMFQVTAFDSSAKTITLDRPLEWDLPVNDTSDGSRQYLINPNPSKLTPLEIVQGVGFENFAFTQDMTGMPMLNGSTFQGTADDAVHNYGNMAPEYAMHGIVFKWAANSWARGLSATMTGSHPIVTEDALNLQIERNSFNGSWNKGKGGNGYLRGSRVWSSLYAYNLSRNLRHFTFQWSASDNVAYRNDLDSDLNLHGGWEHNNLFEQNTVRVVYNHRSASCMTNCGGEGGEIDEGTWYPIWWAAGPKAIKWSGSSGAQNVFYNNRMSKQTTPDGSYVPYAPYGNQTGTAFEFGSDNNDPAKFHHLSQDGQIIPDWTGRETANYIGQGVVARDMGGQPSLFLRDTGTVELDPRQNLGIVPNTIHQLAWNFPEFTGADAAESYIRAIDAIRSQVGVPVIDQLLSTRNAVDSLLALTITVNDDQGTPQHVVLYFQPANMYLVGFRPGTSQTAYMFRDFQDPTNGGGLSPVANPQVLRFTGQYTGGNAITGMQVNGQSAVQNRSEMRISYGTIRRQLLFLATTPEDQFINGP
ncbi:ribosome-inactivating family protein, partial [Streptomyces flaveolus]|uniref:ribosome-inactivating family protein n=1 Tax=Streptomyces flaveolus TaxID=67297 RepID=UPI003436854B